MPSAALAVEQFCAGLRYDFLVSGECLGEWIPDGTTLVADPTLDVRAMDLCAITIRGAGPWARYLRAVGAGVGFGKIFLAWLDSANGRAALVGQLYPPAACLIPEAEISTIHRVVGALGNSLEMTENDKAALALIAPFSAK